MGGETLERSGEGAVQVGAVVRFRDRVWRVDTADEATFTATPLDGRDLHPRRFATELEELASGAIPFPDPSDTGDPADPLGLRLAAVRVVLADVRGHAAAPLGRRKWRPVAAVV